MRDWKLEYWKEALSCALEDIGALGKLDAKEQESVAGSLASSAENQHMCDGNSVAENPLKSDNVRLTKALDMERRKVTCKECRGSGVIIDHYVTRSSSSRCDKCNGDGRCLP